MTKNCDHEWEEIQLNRFNLHDKYSRCEKCKKVKVEIRYPLTFEK